MTSLESIVLPLEQSRALVEHGIVLDTALRWVTNPYNKEPFVIPVWTPPVDEETVLCPAPVLSELLDAIRAKVGGNDTTAILSRDKSEAGASCAGIRTEGGKYEIAPAPTDLLAAAALLMEVNK